MCDERYLPSRWARLVLVGLGVGFLTGFFGVGGGFLIVPALVVLLGLPMHLAVGTSLLVIALNALWGILGNLQFGTLDWPLTPLFAVGGVVGSWPVANWRADCPTILCASRLRCSSWASPSTHSPAA